MADCCCGGTKLLYACSGACDLGGASDLAARKLMKDGYAKMTCVAAVAAGLPAFIESAKGATAIAIDGCGMLCAKKILEAAGAKPVSFALTDLGYVKGQTPVTDALVGDIAKWIAAQ